MSKIGIDNEGHNLLWHKQHHTEYYQAVIGLAIADMIGINQNADGRYYTNWNTKTPLGLYLSIKRIIRDN